MLENFPTMFNGVEVVEVQEGTIKMTQARKIGELETQTNDEFFQRQRALAQYIGLNCRPDIFATVKLIAPANAKIEERQFKSQSPAINLMQNTKDNGLEYVRPYIESVRIVVLCAALFANEAGPRNQLKFMILMVNKYRCASIVYYGSDHFH